MGLSIVFLVVAVAVVPVLARIFREAAGRNPNTPDGREEGGRRR